MRGCSKFLALMFPSKTAKAEAHALIAETSKSFEQARRYAELTAFEFEESPNRRANLIRQFGKKRFHVPRVCSLRQVHSLAMKRWRPGNGFQLICK